MPVPPGPSKNTPPKVIGRYELQAIIGSGNMGTVYKAYDPRIKRMVALKALTIADPDQRARYQQEARIAGRLNHPHIVLVYDVGEVEDLAYIVMELIEGRTLADLLPTRFAWSKAVRLILPVCQALDYAHRQGIIHRDVKPANILITADGRAKLGDFGIARLEDALRLTQTGAVLGTPFYMAPEQIEGKAVDERSDLFSLGIILFELITGRNPFARDEDTQGWSRLMNPQPPNFSLLEGLTPPMLQNVIHRATADNPADRFASAAEMLTALTALLNENPAQQTLANQAPVRATSAAPLPQVESGGNVTLTQAERTLLAEAFRGYNRLYIERELTGSVGGSRLLVGLPVRNGRTLTRVMLKLASSEIVKREWAAYREYVDDILPSVTADIQTAPLLSPDGKLGLLRYTFAGDVGEQQTETLAAYCQTHSGETITSLLQRRIFQVIAPRWWLDREAYLFLLYQEYDHLLPAHVVIKPVPSTKAHPLLVQADTVKPQDIRHLQPGQLVQIQGFQIQSIQSEQRGMMLQSPQTREPMRLQLIGLSPEQLRYRPGELAPDFLGAVIETRHLRLLQIIQAAFPTTDLHQAVIDFGEIQFPGRTNIYLLNPLNEYERLLEQKISGMKSIIHGNLTLENILVEPSSRMSWLFDFSNTRQGHNLYDFLHLETQIVTQMLPPLVVESETSLDGEIIAMVQLLHRFTPPSNAPHPLLQKPYDLLRAIRQQAGQCMSDVHNWNEYYLGLIIMLLGSLPAASKNLIAIRLAFTWAGAVHGLVDQPLYPSLEEKEPASSRRLTKYHWFVLGLIGLAIAQLILWMDILPPSNGETPAPVVTAASMLPPSSPTQSLSSATPTPPPHPTETATSPSVSKSMPGVFGESLNIYRGPGVNYSIIGSAGKGTKVQITGRNTTGDWWQIAHPAAPGGFGWVEAQFVSVEMNGTPALPVAAASPPPTITPTAADTPTATTTPTTTRAPASTPTALLTPTATVQPATSTPSGTAIPPTEQPRFFVRDAPGYRALIPHLAGTVLSESFSPNGDEIAITEGIKLYTVDRNGTYLSIWMEQDETIRPIGGAVWSPDGRTIAFMADYKQNCPPCREVGLVHLANGEVDYLKAPSNQETDLPRWTRDGRLLVTVHNGKVEDGVVYVYDTFGRSNIASGSYILSSSHEGQKWFPWLPGKTWQVDQVQPTSYYD